MTRFIRGVVVAALLLLLGALPVYAHADLEESDPADGETITTPYTLTATFSEEFDPDRSFIRVENAAGEVVAEGEQDPDDATVMTADLPALDPGEYTVRWQTTTPDDNGVERGTFTFDVAQGGGPGATFIFTPSPTATQSTATTPMRTAASTPSPTASGGQPAGASNDILLALALGAIALAALGLYLYRRSRR